MEYLRAAGFTNRKVARKAFFQKARVCICTCSGIVQRLTWLGPLRLRLRARPRLPRSIPPAHDVLV
jgi:hypothetical protein